MTLTMANVWGGDGFEVHDCEDLDERPDPRLRWHVMVNGVGSWPVAWFYEEDDARFWAAVMNEQPALRTRSTQEGDKG